MAGHSKWKQIRHKKGITDQKRGRLFSKLLNAIRIAAKLGPYPEFNPRLKAAIAKAKAENIPQENIERAITQAREKETEELTIEAYGPGGSAMLISAATDNKNRTIAEVKNILHNFGGKVAHPGAVMWAFEKTPDGIWLPKFPQAMDGGQRQKLDELIEALNDHDDVIKIYKNAE